MENHALQSAIRHLKLADFSTVVRACAAIFCSSAYPTTHVVSLEAPPSSSSRGTQKVLNIYER